MTCNVLPLSKGEKQAKARFLSRVRFQSQLGDSGMIVSAQANRHWKGLQVHTGLLRSPKLILTAPEHIVTRTLWWAGPSDSLLNFHLCSVFFFFKWHFQQILPTDALFNQMSFLCLSHLSIICSVYTLVHP